MIFCMNSFAEQHAAMPVAEVLSPERQWAIECHRRGVEQSIVVDVVDLFEHVREEEVQNGCRSLFNGMRTETETNWLCTNLNMLELVHKGLC